jgi:3-dehydroquinate dehydratase-2
MTTPLSAQVLVVHGPNLNLLGTREPAIYGSASLADINAGLVSMGARHGVAVHCEQSNHEGVLIDKIQASQGQMQWMIINPAAFTHTSVALRDAIAAIDVPFVEVHLSNIHQRESFRHHSYFSDKAVAVICGLGPEGYRAALRFVLQKMNRWTSEN